MAGPSDLPAGSPRRNEAVTALGIVTIVIGGLHMCCGLVMTVFMGAITSFFGVAAQNTASSGDPEAAKAVFSLFGLLAAFGAIIGVVVMVIAALYIVAGYGLLNRRQWGRILTLVLGALAALAGLGGLSNIAREPSHALSQAAIGIGYCVFAYVVLLNKETAEEFS